MQIKKESVREQVLRILKKDILNNTYPMGSKINLDELKRKLGISNTPLREAISILEGEGLLEYRVNSGVYVVSPSREDCFYLAQYTLFLMHSAYDYCVKQCESGERSMEGLFRNMHRELKSQKKYVDAGDWYHYALYSNSFDRCVIEWTGNPYLIRNYQQNYTLLTLMNAEYAQEDAQTMAEFYQQHEQILEAMEASCHERVHILLEEHYYKPRWVEQIPAI